jgi:tetratricopeptide (TPR) repeat protein
MLEEIQRREALIHFQRGLVLERAHRVKEAVKEYRRAISHDPHLREAHDALGFYYQRHGLLAKAAEEFRIVANLDDDFLAHFNLGYVLLELERFDEAIAAFQRCIELEPENVAVHYELGYIAYLQGDYRTALERMRLPLLQYPDDWEVYYLIGNCHLRLGEYDAALDSYVEALALASQSPAQAQLRERIAVVERYRMIGQLNGAKDRLYAEHGVVYLGSARDNGLQLGVMQEYHLTFPDIGITLRRFLALCDARGWQFSCVVALDRVAEPLASALAQLLSIELRGAHQVQSDEVPLVVMAVGREAELLDLALERIAGRAVTFCLALNWLRRRMVFPDVMGVMVQGACSVPWEPHMRRLRSDGAPTELLQSCLSNATQHILLAVHDAPEEQNLEQQVQYYCLNDRLRFASYISCLSAT